MLNTRLLARRLSHGKGAGKGGSTPASPPAYTRSTYTPAPDPTHAPAPARVLVARGSAQASLCHPSLYSTAGALLAVRGGALPSRPSSPPIRPAYVS